MRFEQHIKSDLHLHTNCSDGIFSPEQVVQMAKENGLDCIAITDHDTVCGVKRAMAEAEKLGIKYIVGAELSTVANDGKEVHILAYNIDIDAPGFAEEMQHIADFRKQRNIVLQQKLQEHGFDIDVMSLKADGSVGRADIARVMVEKGYCKNVAEAFDLYIGAGKPCYVQTRRLTPCEAIAFTLRFGGIPVLAHPKNLRLAFKEFEKFLHPLVLAGLGGIEAQYFTHNISERKYYSKVARENKLVITGGSDFHDYNHGVPVGQKFFVPSGYTRKILGI